jgi:hypothetical protein
MVVLSFAGDMSRRSVLDPLKFRKHIVVDTLQFDGCAVSDAPFVKNLGVHFDKALNMEKHVSALVKSCFAQIRTIGRIRPYLTESACKTLVATLVTSRMDYGNAILYGINNNVLSKLQRVQNTAARHITRKRKYDHITPELISK